ncbi:hypothetical protein WG66_007917 [Moniliophthora roreri]|nr:hypothetical protein WG66_007917 [Moniliophthora roreri]
MTLRKSNVEILEGLVLASVPAAGPHPTSDGFERDPFLIFVSSQRVNYPIHRAVDLIFKVIGYQHNMIESSTCSGCWLPVYLAIAQRRARKVSSIHKCHSWCFTALNHTELFNSFEPIQPVTFSKAIRNTTDQIRMELYMCGLHRNVKLLTLITGPLVPKILRDVAFLAAPNWVEQSM